MDGLSMNDQALDTRGTMTCPNNLTVLVEGLVERER
jgi:hypothetical protein